MTCTLLGACGILGPHEQRAEAVLRAVGDGRTTGHASLTERREGVQITYDIKGLAPNTQHTFLIHAGGGCGGVNAADIGPRFDVPNTLGASSTGGVAVGSGALGGSTASKRADRSDWRLTRIWADSNGVAVGFFVLPGLTLDGVRSIVGRTLAIHRGADDWDDTATVAPRVKDAGGRVLACGIIVR